MDPKVTSGAYVREWMESVNLKQAELVKRLGWSKAKAHDVWHGEQRYNEDMLNEVALIVGARPYELLMRPDEAHRRRRIEADLRRLAAEEAERAPAEPATVKKAANGGQ